MMMGKTIRRVNPGDHQAIEALHKRAPLTMPWLWWWEDHLADEAFIVIEQDGVLTGALFACADGSPVAWVRLAALDRGLSLDEWLDLSLPPVMEGLRRRGIERLAWMDYDAWAAPALAARGFGALEKVITLIKLDRALPLVGSGEIHLRRAQDAETPILAAIGRAAFTPHWWQSEQTISRRIATSPHLAVAEAGRAVVGYVDGEMAWMGDPHRLRAHVNRIVVHPAYQGRGIGALLLADALRQLWELGAEQVTLNTQEHNAIAHRLYRRFGFEPTGEVVCAWDRALNG